MALNPEVYKRLKHLFETRTREQENREILLIEEFQRVTGQDLSRETARRMLIDFDSVTDDERWNGEEELFRQEELDEMGRLGRVDIKDDTEGNE